MPKPYTSGPVTLHHGNMLEVLAAMPAESVDSIVTDPPYELGFMGKAWDSSGIAFQRETWAAALRVLKPGGHLLAFGGTRTYHRMTCAIEDAGFEVRDCISWLYGQGFPKSLNLKGEWNGWGTALKPATEPIVLARKPLNGTVAANVLKHGTGALNVDGCRVEGLMDGSWGGIQSGSIGYRGTKPTGHQSHQHPAGRWPANVILDGHAAAALDAQTVGTHSAKPSKSGHRGTVEQGMALGRFARNGEPCLSYADSGGASRFFYVAKSSRKERGEGNTHATVKPLALMRYLVRLVTPPGGLVLDPFAGSGTTLLAAREEGFRAVGVEMEREHCAIIRRRLKARGAA